MVCLRNISVDNLHEGDTDDDDDNNNNNDDDNNNISNNNNKTIITDKQNKYQELGNEMCAMWKQNTAQVIPLVISSTGVSPKSSSSSPPS
jgi:hypothetical protein